MKRFLGACGVILTIAGLCHAWPDEKPKPAGAGQAAAAQGTKAPTAKTTPAKTPPAKAQAEKTAPTADTAAPAKRSPDEEAALQAVVSLVKAFRQRDAKAFAAAFTTDGEYLDEQNAVYHGRKAIEDDFTAFFKTHPETSIEVVITSTRQIAPGLIAADGSTHFTRVKDEPPVDGHCSFICAKEANKWLIASLREIEAGGDPLSHHEHVKQLDWMVGEWVDEAADSHIHFTCRWDDSENFLLRDFEVQQAGQKTMSGTQRIGYDPITGLLKSWVFDSAGGYADGYFHRDGDSWILHASGASADGRMANGVNIFTRVDDHRMTWGAFDRIVGGERVQDLAAVTIVRKPPAPAPRK